MQQPTDLVLFGAGDFARLAHHYFSKMKQYRVLGFVVDDSLYRMDRFESLPIWKYSEFLTRFTPQSVHTFVAIGYSGLNRHRAEKYQDLKKRGYKFASFATEVEASKVGEHVFIFPGAVVQPFVEVGNNTIIWAGAVICHDTVIGNHCFVGPRAVISGHVRMGDFSFVGLGATIKNHVTIGERTLVGAGALIVKDTAPDSLWKSARAVESPKKSSKVEKI